VKPSHWTALAIYLTDMHYGADNDFFWPLVCWTLAVGTAWLAVYKDKRESQAARQEPPQR
jgi:hypothetical protein